MLVAKPPRRIGVPSERAGVWMEGKGANGEAGTAARGFMAEWRRGDCRSGLVDSCCMAAMGPRARGGLAMGEVRIAERGWKGDLGARMGDWRRGWASLVGCCDLEAPDSWVLKRLVR
jgi:hypothetical protein